ncbi:hypothetical protein NSTCB13_00984 [Nostoc sp. DSM 114160]|jgi:N-acetylglucosaminyldiphosphoundecaprenol N-acetyl-beta-D-mannosaminyltransferase
MAERVARAPYPIRSVGMEWLWRLAMEPTRLWQRYLLGNFIFLRLVLTYAFARRQSEEQSSQITLATRNKSGFENDLNF